MADEPLDETSETQDEPAVPPPPAHIGELAVACVGYVQRTSGVELDFTPETLPLLDHWLRHAATELRSLDPSKAEGPLIAAVAAPAGAYFGEVVRRLMRARWYAPAEEHRLWRIELEGVLLSFNPVGVAVEAVLGKDVGGFGAHFRVHPDDRALAERVVANLGEVPEDEYYAPSSRLEVLQFVADALVASRNEPRVVGDADYGPLRAEAIGAELPTGQGPIEA